MLSGDPLPKHPKLKRLESSEVQEIEGPLSEDDSDEFDGDHCSICLQLYNDRTVIPDCSHEFCYDCIVTWTGPLTPFEE